MDTPRFLVPPLLRGGGTYNGHLLDTWPGDPRHDSLRASRQGSHVELSWQAPTSNAGHDPATLYRVERATVANGTFNEVGSSTTTDWYDIDAATAPLLYYYLVTAENAGGTE